jgi:hypothetical protein
MAFHPSFATNRLVYLNFSEQVGGENRSVTAEFQSTDGGQTLDPATERDLLTVIKPATNHNGGDLAFGPDGLLYIGLGDGGDSANAQNTRRLLGKMLRIDVNSRPAGAPYAIPPGNPFSGTPLCSFGGTSPAGLPGDLRRRLPQSLALELRQPVGDLWVADVGESSSRKSMSSSAAAITAGTCAKARTVSRRQPGATPRDSRTRSRNTAATSASRSRAATCTAAGSRRRSRETTSSAISAA